MTRLVFSQIIGYMICGISPYVDHMVIPVHVTTNKKQAEGFVEHMKTGQTGKDVKDAGMKIEIRLIELDIYPEDLPWEINQLEILGL